MLSRDMGGAMLVVEGVIHFEILEVLFRDMGGAEMCFGRRGDLICRIGGLVVSVRACGMSGPSSNLDPCSFLDLQYVRESRNIPRYAQHPKGGGNWGCCR